MRVAISIAVCWLALAGCSNKNTDTGQARTNLRGSGFQAREIRAVALLRTHLSSIPVHLQRKIRSHLSGRVRDLDVEAAKYSQTSVGGVWIISARNATCIARAGDGAVACDSKGHFVSRGLSFAIFDAPNEAVDSVHGFVSVGVAPDWVQTARLKVGRKAREIVVHENTYGLRSSAPILIEGLEGRGGRRVE